MLITFLLVLKTLLLAGIVAILGYLAYVLMSFRHKVPYVPTPYKIIKKMVEIVEIKKGERVCDLGSGSGRIIIAAAKRYKYNLILGIERSAVLRVATKFRLFFHPLIRKRIQVVNQDFFNLDLGKFDVIFCFLTPEALRILTPKFQLLKKGSRMISYMFQLDDTAGFEEEIFHLSSKDSLYLYKKI